LELGLASLDELEAELEQQQASLLDTPEGSAVEDEIPSVDSSDKVVDESISESATKKDMVETTYRTMTAELKVADATAPLCSNCGNVTQRAGSCYVCTTCGSTTGCS
jgi:ribonucleoside-diphosphate reductase alpha chain